MSVFVTGTDTGVGKTLVSALLVASLRQRGGGYFKPVQTGDESDTEKVSELSGVPVKARPAYEFARPAAPSRAAQAEGREVDLERILEHWSRLGEGPWVVEGAGGLLVPLREGPKPLLTRELIARLGLPVIIVTSTRLGTINHTLLTLESARRAGLSILGLVLNGEEDPGLEKTLRAFDPAPVLARVPMLERVDRAKVQALGPEFFGRTQL
jgi:dethiobiotin synthase